MVKVRTCGNFRHHATKFFVFFLRENGFSQNLSFVIYDSGSGFITAAFNSQNNHRYIPKYLIAVLI